MKTFMERFGDGRASSMQQTWKGVTLPGLTVDLQEINQQRSSKRFASSALEVNVSLQGIIARVAYLVAGYMSK